MVFKNKKEFLEEYSSICVSVTGTSIEYATEYQKYYALCSLIGAKAAEVHHECRARDYKEKEVYYFSMEFLIGKLLDNYLINFGIRDIVKEGLSDIGCDLDRLLDMEKDPGLGNGGLGRLAACFIDSFAALSIHGTGMGLRYKFGLFKQKIVDGEQIEVADDWLENDYPFAVASP
ncbi:MAG: glycogen/starch/alpha-glucan phosphorylase, partial [Lachnospiraceae bacterium]|nr:glycogen/starch/alpha-glucan phosphorylase [Lachnospiraceae bacterium]